MKNEEKLIRFYSLDGDDYLDISEEALKAMDDAADEWEKLREEARKREREEFYFLCHLDD
jgi:hypothetical protein